MNNRPTHPRLAVSAMCTYGMGFGGELALWTELGVASVGVIAPLVDQFGRERAVQEFRERGLSATTLITQNFDLAEPSSWESTRRAIRSAVDLGVEIGGCVYLTPGRRDGRSFGELTSALADALQPCVTYASERGVGIAIEPSMRTDQSFVHSLRDGIDVARAAGVRVIADLGNCWMERDYEDVVRNSGNDVAVVQIADARYGTRDAIEPFGSRLVPGDGDLDVARFIQAAIQGGYGGAFELEMVGPRIVEEGQVAALRRAVERLGSILESVDLAAVERK